MEHREAAAGSGEHELDPSAPSAVSSGRNPRTAVGEQGKRAVAPDEQPDLLRYGLCQRGFDHREFAFVCSAVPASSILQAIAVLGINNLQGMCLTVAARTYMGKALNQPAMQVIWRHNLACALIAEQLASAGFMDKDIAYTSGMLHDIGRLALATVRPKEYAALLQTHNGSGESILEPERNLFGMDHCGIGHHLISDWKLPPDL
jgi:hypothetical protein